MSIFTEDREVEKYCAEKNFERKLDALIEKFSKPNGEDYYIGYLSALEDLKANLPEMFK